MISTHQQALERIHHFLEQPIVYVNKNGVLEAGLNKGKSFQEACGSFGYFKGFRNTPKLTAALNASNAFYAAHPEGAHLPKELVETLKGVLHEARTAIGGTHIAI